MALDPQRERAREYNRLTQVEVPKLDPVVIDHDAIAAIIKVAVDKRLSEGQMKSLRNAILFQFKDRKKEITDPGLRKIEEKARDEVKRHDDDMPDAREERERCVREAAEARERERLAEVARLTARCRSIAESPALLDDMESLVHRLGVIAESTAIRGVFLAAISRLLRDGAVSVLRTGAAASGKNFLLSQVLKLIPREERILITTASANALFYMNGPDDQKALKHKILVIGEAVDLARKANGEEPLAKIVRPLIDGEIDHPVTLRQPDGSFKAVPVRREGPVSVWTTSARSEIEEELLTRLVPRVIAFDRAL